MDLVAGQLQVKLGLADVRVHFELTYGPFPRLLA